MFPGSDDPSTPHPEPLPALALAVAALERALTLVANHKITIRTIMEDKAKSGKLIKADINPVSGKRSTASIAFSEGLWGSEVADYYANIKGLRKSDMSKIVLAARKFSRVTAGAQYEDSEPSLHDPPIGRGTRANIPLYGTDSDADEQSEDEDEDEGRQTVMQKEQSDGEDEGIQQDDYDPPVQNYSDDEFGHPNEDDMLMDYEDGHAPDPMEFDEVRISPAY